jgi:hypothetical protein
LLHQNFSSNADKYDPFEWSVLTTEFNESYLLGSDIRNSNGLGYRAGFVPTETMPKEEERFKYLDRALNLCLQLKGYQYLGLKLEDVMQLDLATLLHLENKLVNYHPDKEEAHVMQSIINSMNKAKR